MRRPIHSNKFWATDQTGCTCDHSPGKNWKNFLKSFFEAHGSWSRISMVWALIRMHVHRSSPILTELPTLAVGPEIRFSKPSRWFYACSIWEPVSEAHSARRCLWVSAQHHLAANYFSRQETKDRAALYLQHMARVQNKHTNCVNSWCSNFFQRMYHSEHKMLIYWFLKIIDFSGKERYEKKKVSYYLGNSRLVWPFERSLEGRSTAYLPSGTHSYTVKVLSWQKDLPGRTECLTRGLIANTPKALAEWMTPSCSCVLARIFNPFSASDKHRKHSSKTLMMKK